MPTQEQVWQNSNRSFDELLDDLLEAQNKVEELEEEVDELKVQIEDLEECQS